MKTKNISRLLLTGVILNSLNLNSLASILSEDGRYETFEGNNITIDNILEEDKVDVEIEGNTMVNVANQKDLVPITKAYTVKGTNHIPLQGEYDGKTRPIIEGKTMYYNNDTGELTDTFVEGANLSLASSFEDQLVTQEMVDSGLEKAENLGKYKVEYKVTNKNKINGMWEIGHDVAGVENPEDKNIAKSVDFIKVQPGNTYTLSKNEDIPSNYRLERVNFYRNGTYVSHSWNETFKVPSDCNEIKVLICNTEGNNFNKIVLSDIPNFQLEEGSIITEYESYKESIKTFYLNTPLLEGDTIEDIDGKATHVKRYSRLIIDGSDDEYWFLNTPYSKGGQYVSYRSVFGIRPKSNSIIYCDKLKYIGEYNGVNDCIWAFNNVALVIQNSTIGTIEEFNQWLLESPITVVYPLAEPIYETISEESILCNYYANGHLDLNTNISVNKVDFMPTTTNLNYLYPSTEYTVQFESDNKGKVDKVSLGDEGLYSNYTVNQGINRFNITTPSEISSTELILNGIGFNLSNLVVTKAVDESFDYFEGIKSVGQDDVSGHNIEIVSSNLDKTQSNTLQIPLNEPLRGLPNGIKDRIIKRNGQWVIERNCEEVVLDGSENWEYDEYEYFIRDFTNYKKSGKILTENIPNKETNFVKAPLNTLAIKLGINYGIIMRNDECQNNLNAFKEWLSNNHIRAIYELNEAIYEPLHINSTINTYLDVTHISNNSNILANMNITIDRTINRATEAIELAKTNPTVANISQARMWSNLLKETINKDELHNKINSITNIEDLQLEKKTSSANVDVYIKSENMLLMSLSTNSITFNNYSGVEDIELSNAINISINSSLPYQLNSYLLSEIENSDKSNRIEKDLLNIKSNIDNNYKTFNNVNEKLILEDDCRAGNNKSHSIDLKLKGSQAHKADIYKTIIKFEAEQK